MRIVFAVCLAGLTVLVAQGGPQEGKKEQKTVTVHVVKMTNVGGTNKFDPADLPEVKVGDAVKWVNEGGTHSATSDDIKTGKPAMTFNTGTVKKGQEVILYFNNEGTFKYHCEFHNGMNGTITVKK